MGGKRMKNSELKFYTPGYQAAIFISRNYDELLKMDSSTFEKWLEESFKSKEIKLTKSKLCLDEEWKRASLHFIAHWYYLNKAS